jgi:DEAD/DEAH box helicase domain-containing protein
LYDGHPGGIGLSARLYEIFDELLRRTHKLIAECDCETGCPSCIQSPKCGHGNVPLDKRAAVLTFEVLLGLRELPRQEVTVEAENSIDPIINKSEDVMEGTKQLSRRIPNRPALPPSPPPSPVPKAWPEGKTGVVFDLETQLGADEVGGWGNIRKMKLGFASIYRFPSGEWLDFWEEDVEALKKVLREADLVIGFNQVRFDYEVLRGYGGFDEEEVQSYDILLEVNRVLGHRLNLNSLASATLGATKSADGLQSLEWWRRGEIEKVATYCRQDVEVTRDLFFHILEKNYLLFEKKGIGLVRVPIKFKI